MHLFVEDPSFNTQRELPLFECDVTTNMHVSLPSSLFVTSVACSPGCVCVRGSDASFNHEDATCRHAFDWLLPSHRLSGGRVWDAVAVGSEVWGV